MAKDKKLFPNVGETILHQGMEEVMHNSMLPYAEHVILERALPRAEDGLKPVQRRILYTMLELSLSPDKPHRKSARIVGDCLGKYHPHGDSSVYDAMVRMAQDFNMSMPLVDGHGNFGSMDGDSAAAMRYTEARMTPLALELLRDLEKDTVDFTLNFDDSLKEPELLPGRFPNLLVNGASGIAVGLATNIAPHNLGECIDAAILEMEEPDCPLERLMALMPCPDFPTGAYILDASELREAYETGRGRILMRAKTEIETLKNGKKLIVIREFPYQVNKAKLLMDIQKLTQEKKLLFSGISDIRDESDREGIRAVIEVKKEADAEKILQYLYKYSDLQSTFGMNMVAIAEGKPQQMGLKQALDYFIRHQKNVVTRRTKFDLEAARRREHILEGLMIAMDHLDEVIALIRASKTPKAAKEGLMSRFGMSEIQAQAILDLRLQRLTNLELLAIEKEYKDTKKRIKELVGILESEKKLMAVIREELLSIREKYALPRRSRLLAAEAKVEADETELKVVEDVKFILFKSGKVRKMPRRLFNPAQLEEEAILQSFDTKSDKKLRLFTNLGSCLSLNLEEIPETRNKPVLLNSLVELSEGEVPVSVLLEEEMKDKELLFFTKEAMVKCTDAAEYESRVKKLQAISLKGEDRLLGVEVKKTEAEAGKPSLLLLTRLGMSIRFETESVPKTGRVSGGVKGMKLEEGDSVLFFAQTEEQGELLVISDRGYAKRSLLFDYELQGRNGKGLKSFDFKKNGSNGYMLSAAFYVKEAFSFVVEQVHGTKTSLNTEEILIESRAGKGSLAILCILDDLVKEAYKKN